MESLRRHRRLTQMAPATVQHGSGAPIPAAQVFNISAGGLALFSPRALPGGELVSVNVSLAGGDAAPRPLKLFGVTRWAQTLPDGNLLGIELVADDRAGDYRAFARYLQTVESPPLRRAAFTMVELCIAMVIICIMTTLAVPIFRRSIEQARVDAAAANLKTIWSAQRMYWLESRAFAPQLTDLQAQDLLSPSVARSAADIDAVYVYETLAADATSFSVRARRNGSSVWSGQLVIDQTGTLSGVISGGGTTLTPTQ
ncbi:MAG: PilZ domain-containing protein [Planctomycetaceae bacterium]|nr:PilZ domain-containing protein [Planctomycetaceae bacterium]